MQISSFPALVKISHRLSIYFGRKTSLPCLPFRAPHVLAPDSIPSPTTCHFRQQTYRILCLSINMSGRNLLLRPLPVPSSALKSYTSFFFFFFCFSFLKFFLFFILFNLLLLLFVNQILHIFKGWVGSVTSFSETLPGEFPGDSVVRTTTFSLRRAQVQFLVGKLPTPPKKEKLFLSSLNSLRAGFHALFLQCLAQSLKYSFTETPSFSILINNASCPLSFFFFTSYNFLTHSTCYLYFAYFLGQGFCFVHCCTPLLRTVLGT